MTTVPRHRQQELARMPTLHSVDPLKIADVPPKVPAGRIRRILKAIRRFLNEQVLGDYSEEVYQKWAEGKTVSFGLQRGAFAPVEILREAPPQSALAKAHERHLSTLGCMPNPTIVEMRQAMEKRERALTESDTAVLTAVA